MGWLPSAEAVAKSSANSPGTAVERGTSELKMVSGAENQG